MVKKGFDNGLWTYSIDFVSLRKDDGHKFNSHGEKIFRVNNVIYVIYNCGIKACDVFIEFHRGINIKELDGKAAWSSSLLEL